MQRNAEDLRAELGAVRAEMDKAAQQAEAARQDNAKNMCRIQNEGDAQVCISFSIYLLPNRTIRTVHLACGIYMADGLVPCGSHQARQLRCVSGMARLSFTAGSVLMSGARGLHHAQVAGVKRQASKALKHMHEKLLAAERRHEELQNKVLPYIKADNACEPQKRYGVFRRMGCFRAQVRLAVEVHCRAIQQQQVIGSYLHLECLPVDLLIPS